MRHIAITMLLIITHPEHVPNETQLWQQLLHAGADAILLRKPQWPPENYAQVLEQTDPVCYSKIMIAGHWELYQHFGLMGVHLSGQQQEQTDEQLIAEYRRQGCRTSTGIHNVAALPLAGNAWDYLLLSPVFDSISKPGYKAQIPPGFKLQKNDCNAKVLALGGVDSTNAAQAKQMGFDGLALLGSIWQTPATAVQQLQHIKSIWNDPML
ncbi:thiamine-phosphate pyrophosphorylase [Chitinophaga rupis]|uniref:Thiamine-phosphate pyrophosphorylase n=2 Tax=Chitinophaga rupis TaxID=573321 RepID=A0A1H7JIG1_9BACT|nr:thiamine-phosphate pyrophosphorylase [Chitinophaga rupis]